MYKIEEINDVYPTYGLRYKYFTLEEWKFITKLNGCYTRTRYDCIRIFIKNHKNLEELEKELNCNIKGNSKYKPLWCALLLVSYGRIEVPFKVIRTLVGYGFKDIYYEGSPFININFINKFREKSESLGYCKRYIDKFIFELASISLFFKISTDKVSSVYNEYCKLQSNVKRHNLVVVPILNVLLSLGYENNYAMLGVKYNSRQFVSEKMKPEFMDALNDYLNWYGDAHSTKTVKVQRSHLMAFFNFVSDAFDDIDKLFKIDNKVVTEFIKYELKVKNIRGVNNSVETINHRLECIGLAWDYFIKNYKYLITKNIVTEYDKFKESKKFAKYIDEKSYSKLISALNNCIDGKYFRLKLIIIILLCTGRRIHEVLALQYDCLTTVNYKSAIFFHKFKHNKNPRTIEVNDICAVAVIRLKEMVKNYTIPITCIYDNLKVRRLFASDRYKGICIITESYVNMLFDEFQLENGIVDLKGEPVYNIHDIKRVFVKNLLNLGHNAKEISLFLNQGIDSLLPYEINNSMALKALKIAEEKKLLLGNKFTNELQEEKCNDDLKIKILDILKDKYILNRHKENLMYKIKNPHESMPLALGECIDINSVKICGTIICMACNEIKPGSLEEVDIYTLKFYKYIYKYKRHLDIKEIEAQLSKACVNIYINKEGLSENEMKRHINYIKKQARNEILLGV